MDYLDTLLRRNVEFVNLGFNPNLRMMPSSKSLIIGCVDPRVDPTDLFKLEQGEAAIFRPSAFDFGDIWDYMPVGASAT